MADNVRGQMRDTRAGESKREGNPLLTGAKPKFCPEKRRKTDQKQLVSIIFQAVCEVYGTSIDDILSHGRKSVVPEARMMAMYMMSRHTDMTLAEIGAEFGRRHSTVIHALRQLDNLSQVDRQVCRRAILIFLAIEYLYAHPEYIRQDIVIV